MSIDTRTQEEMVLGLPPLRTFSVIVEDLLDTIYVTAHSYTCEGEVVKFYTYKLDNVDGQSSLVAYATRSLRHWLDVEDVTGELAIGAGSTKLN